MDTVSIYRRRTFTAIMAALFGSITILIITGLIQSYFPRYTGLEDVHVTDTGRTISVIFALITGAVTWRYCVAWHRRGTRPVIEITGRLVRFSLHADEREELYFHDVERFTAIDGNFETAVVTYRIDVPEDSPRYPRAIEVPLGLTMTRQQVLAILNERAAAGASQPAPPVELCGAHYTPDDRDHQPGAPAAKGAPLPPPGKTVRVYWERSAPVVLLAGVAALIALLWWVCGADSRSDDYLLFVKLTTWGHVIIAVLGVLALVITGYLCVALASPKLVITPEAVIFRGETAYLRDLRSAVVESKRKWMAPGRYVTEHFVRLNYLPGASTQRLIGLEPDLLEMSPERIAAIINSRLQRPAPEGAGQ